jgi:hypothetical protein
MEADMNPHYTRPQNSYGAGASIGRALRWVGLIFIVVFVLAILAYVSDRTRKIEQNPTAVAAPAANDEWAGGSPQPAAEPAPIVVSPATLWGDYQRNEIAADKSYYTNIVKVHGTIMSIHRDHLERPCVDLGVGDALGAIQCSFEKTDEDVVAKLSKGDRVTIMGVCGGKTAFRVLVLGCEMRDGGGITPANDKANSVRRIHPKPR